MNVELVETAENKIAEICNSCRGKITYDRIKVARKGKQTYIATINYGLNLVKHLKVMVILVYAMNLSVWSGKHRWFGIEDDFERSGRKMIILLSILLLTTIFCVIWVWRLNCIIDELNRLLKQKDTEIKQIKITLKDRD